MLETSAHNALVRLHADASWPLPIVNGNCSHIHKAFTGINRTHTQTHDHDFTPHTKYKTIDALLPNSFTKYYSRRQAGRLFYRWLDLH